MHLSPSTPRYLKTPLLSGLMICNSNSSIGSVGHGIAQFIFSLSNLGIVQFRPLPKGGLFKVCPCFLFSFSLRHQDFSSVLFLRNAATIHFGTLPTHLAADVMTSALWCTLQTYFKAWMHRRGQKNFCLQKSRMPLAGLVYLFVRNCKSAILLVEWV